MNFKEGIIFFNADVNLVKNYLTSTKVLDKKIKSDSFKFVSNGKDVFLKIYFTGSKLKLNIRYSFIIQLFKKYKIPFSILKLISTDTLASLFNDLLLKDIEKGLFFYINGDDLIAFLSKDQIGMDDLDLLNLFNNINDLSINRDDLVIQIIFPQNSVVIIDNKEYYQGVSIVNSKFLIYDLVFFTYLKEKDTDKIFFIPSDQNTISLNSLKENVSSNKPDNSINLNELLNTARNKKLYNKIGISKVLKFNSFKNTPLVFSYYDLYSYLYEKSKEKTPSLSIGLIHSASNILLSVLE